MSRDNLRPAEYQIHQHYKCRVCGHETEVGYGEGPYDHCGQQMANAGESYPGDSRDWDEERDNEYSPWHKRS